MILRLSTLVDGFSRVKEALAEEPVAISFALHLCRRFFPLLADGGVRFDGCEGACGVPRKHGGSCAGKLVINAIVLEINLHIFLTFGYIYYLQVLSYLIN